MGERRVGVARAALGADVDPARRCDGANAVGEAAGREAVGDEHDIASPQKLPRPAGGRAARARAETAAVVHDHDGGERARAVRLRQGDRDLLRDSAGRGRRDRRDRKSTRLNSSHLVISYAVFCLKKKKKQNKNTTRSKTYR